MTEKLQRSWPVAALAVILVGITLLMIKPYAYNVTSIFHMDAVTAAGNTMPAGFVILNAPSYDGAQYYQVARNIPKIVNPARWPELKKKAPGSYAYQRLLLPLVAFVLALGMPTLLPWAFLLVNALALLLTAGLILRKNPSGWIYALALCLSPAAMVAMHFSLAEPLTILLITLTLLNYQKTNRVTTTALLCLCLVVLAREVNILFVAYLFGWSLLTKKWRDALLLLIPAIVFLGWHAMILGIFGDVPFLMSAAAHRIPGSAALEVLLGYKGYDRLTITSVALMILFVFPGIVYAIRDIAKRRKADVLSLGSLAFFGVMLVMPDYIWGSITSIGRVITPVYPLTLLLFMERDDAWAKLSAFMILALGLATGVALALSAYPYTLTN